MAEFDEFMKQKMSGEVPYPFREEYWEQAAALLEADRRRRRRFIVFWILLAIVILSASWCTWANLTAQKSGMAGEKSPADSQKSMVREDPKAASQSTPGWDPTTFVDNLPSEKSPHSLTRLSDQDSSGTNPFFEQNRPTVANNSINNHTNTKQNFKTTSSLPTGKLHENQPLTSTTSIRNAEQPAFEPEWNNSEPEKNAIDPPGWAPEETSSLEGQNPGSAQVRVMISPLALLPGIAIQPLPEKNPPFLVYTYPTVPSGDIQPAKTRLQLGVGLSGCFYPGGRAKDRLGGTASIFLQKNISQNWSITAGIQYRYRPFSGLLPEIDGENQIQSSTIKKYGFGVMEKQYTLDLKAQHWIEIPLGVNWKRRDFVFSTGVNPGILAAVAGKMKEFEKNSISDFKEIKNQWVHFDPQGFQQFYVAPWIGAAWAPRAKWYLGLRLHYQATAWPYHDSPAGKIWVDAGIGYRMFSFSKKH